ncbi:MAG: peroxiredoxin [Methylophilus sp.]|nr:peroxiredoxin [Methylophilus sp.]
MQSLNTLPANLPVPEDDGACQHLIGMAIPDIALTSTQGSLINLSHIKGWLVIYCYPMTGQPNQALPTGWDNTPGARGCTPQSCAFRDHHQEIQQLGAQVFGLSSQTTAYQTEAAQRLHLPFALLSDAQFALNDALKLPTFEVEKMRLTKRVTLIALDGKITHTFYPVFPPDQNASQVVDWLQQHV